jgi:hypothetical protein
VQDSLTHVWRPAHLEAYDSEEENGLHFAPKWLSPEEEEVSLKRKMGIDEESKRSRSGSASSHGSHHGSEEGSTAIIGSPPHCPQQMMPVKGPKGQLLMLPIRAQKGPTPELSAGRILGPRETAANRAFRKELFVHGRMGLEWGEENE